MKKKTMIVLELIITASLMISGCGGKDTTSASAPVNQSVSTETENSQGQAEQPDVSNLHFESPSLVCSAGQSADFEMVKVMFDQNQLSYVADSLADKSDFGDTKTLIVAIGGSSKGLGAAGIDADAELARVKQLLKDAKDAGIKIIGMHVGGAGRRGILGDRYIEPVIEKSDFCIFVENGNEDGLFTKLCEKYQVPMRSVKQMVDCTAVIKEVFE